MTIEQLELFLCDMYQMDDCLPTLFSKGKQEFRKASYSQWAIVELTKYLTKILYPRTYAELEDYITIIDNFIYDMDYYSKLKQKNSIIFLTAIEVAHDVRELFCAME